VGFSKCVFWMSAKKTIEPVRRRTGSPDDFIIIFVAAKNELCVFSGKISLINARYRCG